MFQKLLFVTTLFISAICFGQSNEEVERKARIQNLEFIIADKHLDNGQLLDALYKYAELKRLDSTTFIGKYSKHKVDSLKPVVRDKLLKEIQGLWKWEQSGSNWGVGETSGQIENERYLDVSGNKLSFYEVNENTKEKTILQNEQLKFSKFTGFFTGVLEVEFSNNEIWNFSLENNNQELYLTNTGELTETSRTLIVCGNIVNTYIREE